MSSFRIDKINSLLQKQVAEIISREINLKPGVLLTVSKVDTSADLRYTSIFVSIFPEKETTYALKTLEKETYKIRGLLKKKISLKIFPRLQFKPDATEARAAEIEKILKDIHKQ